MFKFDFDALRNNPYTDSFDTRHLNDEIVNIINNSTREKAKDIIIDYCFDKVEYSGKNFNSLIEFIAELDGYFCYLIKSGIINYDYFQISNKLARIAIVGEIK